MYKKVMDPGFIELQLHRASPPLNKIYFLF